MYRVFVLYIFFVIFVYIKMISNYVFMFLFYKILVSILITFSCLALPIKSVITTIYTSPK